MLWRQIGTAMIEFQFKTELDPVAVYAAIVSTSAVVFAVIQALRSGPRLVGHASGNMKIYPDPIDGTYLSATIYNRGTRRTKVTTLGLATYPSRWARIRKKSDWKAFIPSPLHVTLPALLEPGDYIIAGMIQNTEIIEKSKHGLLFVEAYYTDGKHPLEIRIKPIKTDKNPSDEKS
jgi:hypothetical protein